jgi:high-affinity nickel permease
MNEFLGLLTFGFLIGIKHAFDSDHVAAVTTLVSESEDLKISSKLGTFWGAGHTATLLIAGIILTLFNLTISERWTTLFEIGIGIMLIVLGVNLLFKIRRKKIHLHQHSHNGTTHTHLHSHQNNPAHTHNHLKKSFIIGTFHGLAGSAGLMLLLLATTSNLSQTITYILIFGLGSIAGMTMISTLISLPLLATKKLNKTHQWIQLSAGLLSVIIGFEKLL